MSTMWTTSSAAEVYMWTLINRARLDPAGEAARLGISLDEGLAPGSVRSMSRQPLALNANLQAAARYHSQDMIDHDYFSHTNPLTGPALGYQGSVGENITYRAAVGGDAA